MILNVNCCIRKIILTSNWFISVRFFKKILPTHSGEMTSSVEVWRPEDGDWSSATDMPEVSSRGINCAKTNEGKLIRSICLDLLDPSAQYL